MKPVRVAALVEARTVTGPAKNLIRFATANRDLLDFHFLTYVRAASDSAAQAHSSVFKESAEKAGIPVVNVWEKGRFDLSVSRRLLETVQSLQPAVVQTHSVKSHFIWSRLTPKAGLPWLAFHHGYTDENFKMRVYNRLDRLSLPKAARVITVCQLFKEQIAEYGVRESGIHVLHNSLDAGWATGPNLKDDSTRIRGALPDGGKSPVVLCVGRFSKEKGQRDLLLAAGLLRDSLARAGNGNGFTLALIGDGTERAELQNLVKERLLEPQVVFLGQQRDVRAYFAAADILALPSLSEGSPNVILEAMAARLPIVATSVGGVGEIVADGESALLVPARSPAALAQALERALSDEQLRKRLAANAYQRLVEKFSPAEYDQALRAIYLGVLGLEATGSVS